MKYTAKEQVEFDWLVENGRTPDQAERAVMVMRGRAYERMYIRSYQQTVTRGSDLTNITIELVCAPTQGIFEALKTGYLEILGQYLDPEEPLRP